MSFDAPWALALFAAIPAILVLWLLRPRRPRLRIPSVMLWPASLAERQSARPWQRLRNHPLLWLQLLIAAFLALAAARPFIPSEAAQHRLIVLLDASGSMRAHDVAPSRWNAAVAATIDLARTLGPDQQLSVIRADDQPRVLLVDVRDASRIATVLASESPAYGPLDAQTTLSLAAGLAQGQPSEWILIGDGNFPLVTSDSIPPDTQLRFIGIGDAHAGNIALSGISLRGNAVQAVIRNASDLEASGSVQLLTDTGSVVATADWSAAPHADAYATWDGIATGPVWFEARLASIMPPTANVLDTDDRAYVISSPASGVEQRALLVTGGNTFLERAVAIDANLRTFKVAPDDLSSLIGQGDANAYALIVLDRRADVPTGVGSASVLRVGGLGGDAFQPRLISPAPDHPLVRNVDWSDVRVGRARHLSAEEQSGWETVVDSDGGPLVLARTVNSDGRPRREAMFTFELGESDLPLRAAFPVLMANLLEWLAPHVDANVQPVAPGGALQLDASPLTRALRVEPVDGSAAAEDLAPPWPARAFHPPAPGVYRLIADNPDGSSVTYVAADAFAPTEADIALTAPAFVHESPSQLPNVLNAVRTGVWPWLLAALLVLASAEWLVDARGR